MQMDHERGCEVTLICEVKTVNAVSYIHSLLISLPSEHITLVQYMEYNTRALFLQHLGLQIDIFRDHAKTPHTMLQQPFAACITCPQQKNQVYQCQGLSRCSPMGCVGASIGLMGCSTTVPSAAVCGLGLGLTSHAKRSSKMGVCSSPGIR